MYSLTYTQAVAMMEQGCKVKNEYFTGEEFFYMKNDRVVDEAGYPMDDWFRGEPWQENGWMVVEDKHSENKQMKVAITGGDMSHLEDRMFAHFHDSIKEMCKGLDFYFSFAPKNSVNGLDSDYKQHKLKKGKGHNKLQKRKKK